MTNKIKPVIILSVLILLLVVQNASAQNKENIPDWLRQKFQWYTENVPREEIYVHTDREEYVSGEYIWFSIYLLDRQSLEPSLNSRIAYFELLNTENRPVVQKRIVLDKGTGPGEIFLPDTLSSGTYTIRVYTSWMKNFLPENCFMKDIKIYNALSRKAFRNKIYAGINIVNGSPGSDPATKTNLTLSVSRNRPDTIELRIKSDQSFRTENNNRIFLFIQTHGQVNLISTENMVSDLTRIYVPAKQLIGGVNQITVFDVKGQPVAERYIYTPVDGKNSLSLSSEDSCKLRSKISLSFDLGDKQSEKLNLSNFSISVTPESDKSEILSLKDYMIFGTEYGIQNLTDFKERSISEFSLEEIDNILLNVKSNWINWTEILSEKSRYFRYKMEKTEHFLTGKLITNTESNVDSVRYVLMCTPGKAPEFQYSTTDKQGYFNFSLDITENLRDLILMPDKVRGTEKLILESSFSDKYPQYGVSSDSVIKTQQSDIQLLSADYQVNKIYKITSLGEPLNELYNPLKPVRFYGKPDIELVLADYISLPTMEEIFFELLPRVSLKKKKSGYEIGIADRIEDNQYVLSPVLLLDGIVINDASIIANLNPENVEKIDVIKDKYLIGKYTFFGLVNVTTKMADFGSIPLPEYMIRLPYKVLEPVHKFASPTYSTDELRNSRIPDFRNTLYWNPSLKPDSTGRAVVDFWSSDIPYNYVITVQGIGPDGKLLTLKKHIRVTQNQ